MAASDQSTRTEDVDAATAAVITQIMLQDLDEITASHKDKSGSDAHLTDSEYACQLQSECIQSWRSVISDSQCALSLDSALATDAAFLEAASTAEAAAVEDRRVAELLSRGQALPPPTEVQARLEQPGFKMYPDPPAAPDPKGKGKDNTYHPKDEEYAASCSDSIVDDLDHDSNSSLLAKFQAHCNTKSESGPTAQASGSSSKSKVSCSICGDDIHTQQALHAPCKHDYCPTCVGSLVENFTRDESLFPLRCCKEPIPIEEVDIFIPSSLRALFLEKHAEFSVPSKDRVYCSSASCSAFLGSADDASIYGTGIPCPSCGASTCLRCKQPEHDGEDCTANAATVEVRAIARSLGWQTCPGCAAVVELSIGCYHMTCRCRTQFCYLCAAEWKACECPQWDENRLTTEAQHRVENDLGRQAVAAMAPEVLQRRVRQRAEVLRYNHECDRHVWRYRSGGGYCEECSHYLPDFLKICKYCSILACVRCTRNRL